MKLLKPILIGLIALLVLLLFIGLFLPSAAHVERSIRIAAPPATVFEIVNSMQRFNQWSPWYEQDPKAQYTFSGPANGVGSRMEWASNELGTGSQEIVESVPHERVRTRLDFGSQGTGRAELSLAPEGEGSKLMWRFDTDFGFNLVSRYFGLILDRVLGRDYEKGLAKLKVLAETNQGAAGEAAPLQISEVDLGALDIAYLQGISSLDPDAIAKSLGAAYVQIGKFMQAHRLTQKGAALAINRFYDESGWGFDAAIPVAGLNDAARAAAQGGGAVKIGQTYAGHALKGVHVGPRTSLPDAYRALEDYMVQKGFDSNGRSWEQYVSDPVKTPEEELQTDIYMPVKPATLQPETGDAR